ncbi:MAG: hypothetical protein WAT23_03550 [Chromatiaceae bacterium]
MKQVILGLMVLLAVGVGNTLAAAAGPADPVSGAEAPPGGKPGSDRDAHGCIGSAGYTWCAHEQQCVRSWELAQQRGFASTAEAFRAYCSGTR